MCATNAPRTEPTAPTAKVDEDDAGATRAGAGEVGAQEREHHGEGHDRGHRVVRGEGREDADRREKHSRAYREEGGETDPEGRAFLRELRAGRARRQGPGRTSRGARRSRPRVGTDKDARGNGPRENARRPGSSPPSAREDRSARTARAKTEARAPRRADARASVDADGADVAGVRITSDFVRGKRVS